MTVSTPLTFQDLVGKTLTIPKELIYQELDGEMVLLDMQSGQYFGIDEVGSRIWQLVEKQYAPAGILKALLEEYDVEESVCREQVAQFFQELLDKKLLVVSEKFV